MSIQSLSETLSQQLSTKRTSLLRKSGWDRLMRQSKFRRRVVRYGLLSLNVVVLLAVIFFVVSNPNSSKQNQQSSIVASSSEQISSNPLDQLSSADIAAQVAQITRLPEAVAVTNQADSVNAQLAVASADDKVISKPQVINTSTKTRKDIQSYTTKSGDTIAALAGKFGVTSDSIRWSNGIYTENLSAGKQLWISPISDGVVYLVKAGDTPQSLADKFRANKDAIISFNDAEVKGLPVGERIVIPGGSQVNPVASGFSFSWLGGAAVYYSDQATAMILGGVLGMLPLDG